MPGAHGPGRCIPTAPDREPGKRGAGAAAAARRERDAGIWSVQVLPGTSGYVRVCSAQSDSARVRLDMPENERSGSGQRQSLPSLTKSAELEEKDNA